MNVLQSDAIVGRVPDGTLASRSATRALVILWLVNVVALIDRVQLPTLLQPIKLEFGLNDAQLGVLTGAAFGLTYAVAALPLAWLADRFLRSRVMSGALLLWGAMTALSGISSSYWHLLLARVGLAAGEAGFTPIAHSILADSYPPRRLGWAIGVETSGGMVGIMAGMGLAGWVGAALGWRAALMIASVPALLLSAVVLFRLSDPPRREIGLPGAGTIGTGMTGSGTVGSRATGLRFCLSYRFVCLVVVAVLNSVMTTGWVQWLPSFFIRSHGLDLRWTGTLVGITTGLGLLVGSLLGGLVSSRLAGGGVWVRNMFCAGVCVAVAPCFVAALWSPSVLVAFTFVTASTILGGMLAPFIFSQIQEVTNSQHRARAVAIAMMFVTIGSYAVMPVLVGGLSDRLAPTWGTASLKGALTALAVAPLVAAGVFAMLGAVRRASVGERFT